MEAPDVRYAQNGDVSLAYGVVGDGPFDVVFVSGWVITNFGPAWEGTSRQLYEGLASFARVILFDKRGTGLSDRSTDIADLETRMDDIRAVMDAAGSKRAAILGFSEGGSMAMLFAATYPERTAATVLYGTFPTMRRADDYPWGTTYEDFQEHVRTQDPRLFTPGWMDDYLRGLAPSAADDEATRRWWRTWVQASSSPGALRHLRTWNYDLDVRHVLPAIRVPTLVLHRVDEEDVVLDEARYIADHIPGAELVELPGIDHGWWVNSPQIVAEIEPFLRGIWDRGEWDLVESEQVLATVLFTDVAGSTVKLAEVGDRRWRELLEQHHALVRRQLARFSGKEVDTAGDGFFASFDGPARAIRCACAIRDGVRDQLGLDVRAGLHAGECEVVDGKVSGIAVHIGARVAGAAEAGEVLVSSTVRDLVAGTGIAFDERGEHELKGVPGTWKLFAVSQV